MGAKANRLFMRVSLLDSWLDKLEVTGSSPVTPTQWVLADGAAASNPPGAPVASGLRDLGYGNPVGAPSFLGSGSGETDVVVAVTSTGDGPCYATNVASRTDTVEALRFLRGLPGL